MKRRRPSDDLGQLRERPQAVLAARLRDLLVERAVAVGAPPVLDEHRLDLVALVPDLEGAHLGEPGDRPPVLAGGGAHRALARLRRQAAVARGDLDARGQPLDVPLERARERLVEVVEVEDHPAVGPGERAEVAQVRVAAQLHLQARRRESRRGPPPSPRRRRGRTRTASAASGRSGSRRARGSASRPGARGSPRGPRARARGSTRRGPTGARPCAPRARPQRARPRRARAARASTLTPARAPGRCRPAAAPSRWRPWAG